MSRVYRPVSDAAHVLRTEEALKHWDLRRAGDRGSGIAVHNIGQMVSRMAALLRALAWMRARGLDPASAQVLDVGAAQGYGLRPFLVAGFSLAQLHGLDLFADRVEEGLLRTPGMQLKVGDATAMPYADRSFDLVCEQFCFCHVPDDDAKADIAREMMRVSRGFILIHDWRMGSSSRKLYGVSKARIRGWFPGWDIAARFRSQLWPPIGRPISRLAPMLYDLARLAGPLVGSWMTVLARR
jgi:SAM-dependent methyltransferase